MHISCLYIPIFVSPAVSSAVSRCPYLHDLILELWEEEVHDLVLLDGERVQVDLLHGLDLASLDETAQLGNWLPLLLLVLVGATAGSTASASAVTTSTLSSTVCMKKNKVS